MVVAVVLVADIPFSPTYPQKLDYADFHYAPVPPSPLQCFTYNNLG